MLPARFDAVSRVSLLTCALLLAGTTAASGFALVLVNDIEHAKVTLAGVPGQRDVFVVAWRNIPGVTPAAGAIGATGRSPRRRCRALAAPPIARHDDLQRAW